jgi:hypothetical protein
MIDIESPMDIGSKLCHYLCYKKYDKARELLSTILGEEIEERTITDVNDDCFDILEELFKKRSFSKNYINTALDFVCCRDETSPNCINFLMDKGAEPNKALITSCIWGNLGNIKSLIDGGADVNFKKGKPLKTAIEYDNLNVVKLLLERGADIGLWIDKVAPSNVAEFLKGKIMM